jgi:type II secretion system protein N
MNRYGELVSKGWRGVKNQAGVTLAGAALFFLAFLLGLHLFFPVAAVRQWLGAEIAVRTPVSVQLETLSLSPLFTLSGRQTAVFFGNRTLPPVVLDELRLKPLWTSLVTGNPGLAVEASLLQGQLKAAFRRSGDLALHVEGLQLKALPVSQEIQTLLSGTIVKGELRGSFPPQKSSENQLSLEMDNTMLTVMGQPFALGKLSAQGSGQGHNLRITALTASGGDVAITGNGTLLLGASTAASRISLDLTLRPTPAVAALLDFAAQKQPDNSYRLRVSGAVSEPTIERVSPAVTRQPIEPSDE